MLYQIITKDIIDFSDVPKAVIESYTWKEGYYPKAFAQLLKVEGKGFALHMECAESNPRTTYFKYNDPVYKDSCLEFFCKFIPDGDYYMNFEMNSYGACIGAKRIDRYQKTELDKFIEIPKVTACVKEDSWSVETFFSFEQIESIFGKCDFSKGAKYKGNFYKCGDDTAVPHYGTWAPITLPKADFHQPGFFGDFIIV